MLSKQSWSFVPFILCCVVILSVTANITAASTPGNVCDQLDVQGDGLVTPSDVVYVINRIGQSVPPASAAADFDSDNLITVDDADATLQRLQPLDCALWIWTDWAKPQFSDSAARTQYINDVMALLVVDGFNRAYLHGYILVNDYPGTLAAFLDLAENNDIKVELLAGDPAWVTNQAPALQYMQNVLAFLANHPERDIHAAHLDVEPQELPSWTGTPNTPTNHALAKQYLDLVYALRAQIAQAGEDLPIHLDIPFWYDEITFEYMGVTQSLMDHVMVAADGVTVLAYRDAALGVNCIVPLAQRALTAAQSHNIPVVVGLETIARDSALNYITFHEEGKAVLARERRVVDRSFWFDANYAGIAVHHYDSWSVLPEQTGSAPQCTQFGE